MMNTREYIIAIFAVFMVNFIPQYFMGIYPDFWYSFFFGIVITCVIYLSRPSDEVSNN